LQGAEGVALRGAHQVHADTMTDTEEEMRFHFNAFYDVLQAGSARRRLPRRPIVTLDYCPITVLGLGEALVEELKSLDEEEAFSARARIGVRTLSCIMATAEQS
jgi:hypothetical protein